MEITIDWTFIDIRQDSIEGIYLYDRIFQDGTIKGYFKEFWTGDSMEIRSVKEGHKDKPVSLDMTVDEMLQQYKSQLERDYGTVELIDERKGDDMGFIKLKYNDGTNNVVMALFQIGDKIIPFDFSS